MVASRFVLRRSILRETFGSWSNAIAGSVPRMKPWAFAAMRCTEKASGKERMHP
ncbi:hypothetical protein EDC27_3086 [Desulfosoma caldarium]|uniref:Uncharacterized protein n=1 Tax=Desulfosoma caldarium TaxID=610254 RepID=A0A3N1ULH5_9BACT|nr:hypothetical protein EDC27_3086 [Desulfosoma caldarium]